MTPSGRHAEGEGKQDVSRRNNLSRHARARAIILDVMLLWSRSFLITAVICGLSFGLIFYPANWSMLAVFHQPVEYIGMVMTIADIQEYHYVRTGTPEYIRFVEKGTLRTFEGRAAGLGILRVHLCSHLVYLAFLRPLVLHDQVHRSILSGSQMHGKTS